MRMARNLVNRLKRHSANYPVPKAEPAFDPSDSLADIGGVDRITFGLSFADNGVVITGRKYDSKRERFDVMMRVCREGDDVMGEIAAILAESRLRR